MALWVCGGEAGCGTKYAVGLFRCPRCRNEEFYEDGDPMAKISRNGGASVDEPDTASAEPEPLPESDPQPETVEVPEVEGGEESSPGSSSSASTETPQLSSEPSSKPTRKPARTTGSRSGKARTGSSSAPSTDGGPETDTSAADE